VALAGAELLGLSAIVVAQPIFDALERSTYAFPVAQVGGSDLVLFTVLLILLPPAVMLAIELLAGLASPSLRGLIHLAWVGLLIALFVWQVLTNDEVRSGILRLLIPAAALVGATIVYLRFDGARQLLRILAFAAPIVAGLFLFTDPISSFTFPESTDVPKAQIDSRTPVVLLIFDEFPMTTVLNNREQVDAKRFPNFAALSRHSDWFRNAETVADTTEQAVPAILTGDFPKPNGVASYSDHPRNLFTLFGGSSYRMNISESQTDLCPPDVCSDSTSVASRLAILTEVGGEVANSVPFNLVARAGQQLEDWFPSNSKSDSATPDPTCPTDSVGSWCPHKQLLRFAADLRARPQASLNVVHVELPHAPWQYMPSGLRYSRSIIGRLPNSETWLDSPGYPMQALQRLTLQLQYTDLLLGRVIARLRRLGLYDKALFIVLADHGASHVPGHSHRLLGNPPDPIVSGAIVHVPLFVKLPGQQRGRTIDKPVRTIDVVPTIADVLGFQIPWKVDGGSLLGPDANPERFANRYMSYRHFGERLSPQAVRSSFLAELAVRNKLLGHGNIFTYGVPQSRLKQQLAGARELDYKLDPNLTTTWDPGAPFNAYVGYVPSYLYGTIVNPPRGLPQRLIATLNGRPVAGAWSLDGGTKFTTLIPPSAFHHGENQLQLYAPG
jgi:hypothetical protein